MKIAEIRYIWKIPYYIRFHKEKTGTKKYGAWFFSIIDSFKDADLFKDSELQ